MAKSIWICRYVEIEVTRDFFFCAAALHLLHHLLCLLLLPLGLTYISISTSNQSMIRSFIDWLEVDIEIYVDIDTYGSIDVDIPRSR